MTVRRLNYTGCLRIRRADIAVGIDDDTSPASFTVVYALEHYEFPKDALVIIEAQAHWTLMRFECGTVSSDEASGTHVLHDFDSADGIRFRIKVIGTGENAGLILGEADGIRPAEADRPEEARSFLAVQPADLGQVPWRLSLVGPEPLLQINEKVADWRSFMRRPEVHTLLLPEIYRQLLREALRNSPDIEESDAWQFAVLGMVPPAVGSRPSPSDDDAVETWIDDAVRCFASKHKLMRGITTWLGASE
jgi:hypothetical protein